MSQQTTLPPGLIIKAAKDILRKAEWSDLDPPPSLQEVRERLELGDDPDWLHTAEILVQHEALILLVNGAPFGV